MEVFWYNNRMKWFLYNVLFAVAYAVMMPSFFLRMKRRGGYRARMGDRFGKYPESIVEKLSVLNSQPSTPVWIHAVSVGEVAVAGQLMRTLREKEPSIRFVFSTTSSTGWKQAEKQVTENDVLIYNPLDFCPCVKRALDMVNPQAVILTESEIWPNFIRAIRKRSIPLFLVNARVSDRSAPRYRKLKWFFGEIFASFTKIFAQSDLDAQRLIAAGARKESVEVTGSFKFDVACRNEEKEREISAWIRGEAEALPPVLLGASTWPGEDKVMLRIYRELLKDVPSLRLVLVPRHFEKADEVEANIREAGFECVRRSRGDVALAGNAVFLGDTTGEMMGFFGCATIAFVGKSLCEHGSQNMIEPCLCGVPTIVGPYTENFRPVMSDLLSADAILQVRDEAEMLREMQRLIRGENARKALGGRAKRAVERRCGVTGRSADELLKALN